MIDPIDKVVWVPSKNLNPNFWNPNVVFSPELKLLERNILKSGWTQALQINPGNMIIDGYHRWWLSMNSEKLQAKYAREVPCVTLDITDAEAMLQTVATNRARGTHVAERMSHLVQRLVNDHGYSIEQIGDGIGAKDEEVRLLLAGDIFKHRNLDQYEYSKAWEPIEVTDEERQRMIDDGVNGAQIMAEREDALAPEEDAST